MRIESINVDGFGVWHDTRIEPHAGLTLVVGPNEAGKTTLLAFVRAMLFGFETNRYPALAGGRRGGWLDVATDDGRRYRVERYGDRGGEGQLRVIDDAGVDRGPAGLRRILHSVEASVYRNVFAFRLEELTEFRGLTEGEVASRIYGAGLGTGATSALAIESALRTEAGSLFKSGGQNPTINVVLREVEEIDRQLDLLDLPADYATALRRLAEREAERTSHVDRLDALAAESRALERICAGWEPWLSMRQAEESLASLPDVGGAPLDALVRLSAIEQSLRAAQERLSTASRRRERLDGSIEQAAPNDALLAAGAQIERLSGAREVERARRETIEQVRGDGDIAGKRAEAAIGELGAGWDEERVAALDVSVAVRSAISGPFRDRLEGARRSLERARDALVGAEATLAEAEGTITAIRSRLGTTTPTAAEGRGRARVVAGGLAVISTAIAIALFITGAGAGAAAAVAFLGLMGAAAAWWSASARTAVAAATPAAAGVEWLAAAVERRDLAAGAAEAARLAVADAETADAEVTREWMAWLEAHDLPRHLDRESAMAVLDAVSAVRAELRRREDAARSVERLEAASAAFVAEGTGLLRELGSTTNGAGEIGGELDRLGTRLRVAQEAERDRRRLTAELAEVCDDEAVAAERLAGLRVDLDELLGECGATTIDEARERVATAEARRAREDAAASARAALTALSGPGPALDRLVAEIAGIGEIEERRARLEAIRVELDEANESRDAAAEEIGALQHELRRLEASVEASELRQRRADLVAKLEAEAQRWAVRSLAVELLKRTRRNYEREHRPGVVRAAEAYLADWTAGRYTQIIAPLGGTIEGLERSDGRQIPLTGLSRGTAEQLYLALRFGLIEHFAEEAEPLPIVMDEILVNFDTERAARAARSIELLARRHQVLYFTYGEDTPLRPGSTVRLQPAALALTAGAPPAPAER